MGGLVLLLVLLLLLRRRAVARKSFPPSFEGGRGGLDPADGRPLAGVPHNPLAADAAGAGADDVVGSLVLDVLVVLGGDATVLALFIQVSLRSADLNNALFPAADNNPPR